MNQSKQEFEKSLHFFAKGAQWYVLPFTVCLTAILGYMAFSMGAIFNSTQITLIVLFVVMCFIDALVIWNVNQK
ncbi:MAG: hypothetical protein ACRDAO_03445 [Culicoidibacterales bacterium]